MPRQTPSYNTRVDSKAPGVLCTAFSRIRYLDYAVWVSRLAGLERGGEEVGILGQVCTKEKARPNGPGTTI
jgi:hypothetical protein